MMAYDYAGTKCLGGPQDGTKALRDACLLRWRGLRDGGIYNCRQVRGGSTLSLHAEGRAVDLMTTDKALGDEVAAVLVELAEELGVQEVIWWRRRWTSRAETWSPYSGVSPHTDHVHVGQHWAGANDLTFTAAAAALDDEPEVEDDGMVIAVNGVKSKCAVIALGRFYEIGHDGQRTKRDAHPVSNALYDRIEKDAKARKVYVDAT